MGVKNMKKMKPKINYFVGPFGCGKTTLIKRLYSELFSLYIAVLEDKQMIYFLKNPEVKDRQSFYLSVCFYKLKKAIDDYGDYYINHKGILFDGHPLLGLIYARTFFEIEYGKSLTYPEWGLLNRQHTRLYNFVLRNGLFDGFDQKIWYINIPFEENWNNVIKRGRTDTDEIDEWYLMCLRKILHQEIYNLADYYRCEIEELNSIEEMDNLKL